MLTGYVCSVRSTHDIFLNVCISVLVYYCSVLLCYMWTQGRIAVAFATANGDPNKSPKSLNGLNVADACHKTEYELNLHSAHLNSDLGKS